MEGIFALISFVILTYAWIYISSKVSFLICRLLRINYSNTSPMTYSIVIGMGLEITLSVLSLSFVSIFHGINGQVYTGVLHGLEIGKYSAILISPLSSIAGAIIGIRRAKFPRKHF